MDKPIRVLCVFSTLDRGGAETMCMNIYRELDRSKVQFDFVKHTTKIGSFEKEILLLGGKIYEAPRLQVGNIVQYMLWWKNHFEKHPEHKIIHGHFFTISPVYFFIARKYNRITVAHSHIAPYTTVSMHTIIKKVMLSFIEPVSDYCFACSEAAGAWLFPHRKFKVLNNAVDTELFEYDESERSSVRKELGIADEDVVIGTVGRMFEQKNPIGLVKIFNEIYASNSAAKLLWVGDGEMRHVIEQKIRELNLNRVSILTGVRSDVYRMMQAMDVFVLPSLYEGLPVVLIEAQAAGLPCFVSDRVTKEVDITGLCEFIPIDNYQSWREKICSHKRMRTNTKEKIIAAGYDIRHTAKWIERFYLRKYRQRFEV